MQIIGADLTADGFTRAGITAQLRAGRVIGEMAGKVYQTQRQLVPKRSRKTHDSIDVEITDHGLTAIIGPTWFVGRFLEDGTVKMAPRPFVGPSADLHAPELEARLNDVAGDI